VLVLALWKFNTCQKVFYVCMVLFKPIRTFFCCFGGQRLKGSSFAAASKPEVVGTSNFIKFLGGKNEQNKKSKNSTKHYPFG